MREIDEVLAEVYSKGTRDGLSGGVPPRPHWPGRELTAVNPRAAARDSLPAAELQWPPLVLTLERQWGPRFRTTGSNLARGAAAAELQGHSVHELPSRRRPDDPGAHPCASAVAPSGANLGCRCRLDRPHGGETSGPAAGLGSGRRGRRWPGRRRRVDRRLRGSSGTITDAFGRRPAPRFPGKCRLDLHAGPAAPRV